MDILKWNRRDFLKWAGAGTLAALSSGFPRMLLAKEQPAPRADAMILLWLAGGVAHTETFDPKRHTPFQVGMREYRILSTFKPIDTVVDNIKISEGLERIAKIIDRGTVIRSFTPPDLGHILHSRHQYHWHTGYTPPQSVAMPHIGSMIVRTLGPRNGDVPPFVHIGQRLDIAGADEVKPFITSGFLGSEYAPLVLPNAEDGYAMMNAARGMSMQRFQNRYKLYRNLVAESVVGEFGSDYQRESLMRALDNSYRLINSPAVRAFNLKEEPEHIYNSYNTGRFGLGCLLARRLIEAGTRFVEVSSEHVPFGNWDTHDSGHQRTKALKQWIDAPISQLILDLEERGLLDRTLVVIASEFSRSSLKDGLEADPKDWKYILHNHTLYGLHRHFTRAGCIVAFGGGFKRGFVYGRTNDEVPCETVENPISLIDFHATMYQQLGIAPDTSYEHERRPVYVTDLGKGVPQTQLLV